MATGVFHTARTGHNMRSRKRKPAARPLDQFAELLSRHSIEAGDTGGRVADAALRMGITVRAAGAMLQRLRKELGAQAR